MTSADPLASGQKPFRQTTPRKTGQSSRMPPRAREILARTATATGGVHAERPAVEVPKGNAAYAPGTPVKLEESARRALGRRARAMTVVACECPLCRDGRWVAVNEPWKYDPNQRQHFACSKLRRAGKVAQDEAHETQEE